MKIKSAIPLSARIKLKLLVLSLELVAWVGVIGGIFTGLNLVSRGLSFAGHENGDDFMRNLFFIIGIVTMLAIPLLSWVFYYVFEAFIQKVERAVRQTNAGK